ncbi:hypothetical protein [Fusobacterium ulcerans]|uniref:hypothetical protein n=1 Tax=Fusobacterium ulcerans TaxID=861 RepID=UPI0026F332F1|nr:hypothetical protein [Fusobacterium ulcerans]
MEENKKLYFMLEQAISDKKISQSEIARKLEVNRSDINLTLKNLKQGKSITTKKFFSLLEVLEISIALKNK